EQIAKDAAALPQKSDQDRQQAARDLAGRKAELSNDVSKLEAQADAAARQARKDQPGAASRLAEAAEAIRDNRIKDKIDMTRQQQAMNAAGSEYMNGLEDRIKDNLSEVSATMQRAVTAMTGEAPARAQDKALEQVRDQIQGLESLRDRTGARTGMNQQEQ